MLSVIRYDNVSISLLVMKGRVMANPEKIVTREIVFEVADRLKAAGIDPTNRKVLQEIGGGSMTTIASHLRDWKTHQEIPAPVTVEVAVPPAVAKTGADAVAAIWQACNAEAKREFESVTEQANQRVKAAEDERDRVLTELSEAEADLNAEREAVVLLREKLAELQEQNNSLSSEAAQARAVVHEVERRASSLAASVQAEREQCEKLVQSERKLATELATAQANNTHLAEQLDDVKKRGAAEIVRMSERAQKVEAESMDARKEAKEAAAAASKLSGQVETLRKQVASQETMIKNFAVQGDKKGK